LLTYPHFKQTFEIHTDASKVQLGACISQEGRPVAFYSRNLNPAQIPVYHHRKGITIHCGNS
jgi:RNase H-like domain found in reverse transcriptase